MNNNITITLILSLTAIIVFGMHSCSKSAGKVAQEVREGIKDIGDMLSSKQAFDATFGPLISQRRISRLQFQQVNQVCLFRIIRFRGQDKENHNLIESYQLESEKTSRDRINALLGQICEIEAKGVFEFNYYIDMGDLSKWSHAWSSKDKTLTIYMPEVQASTPAETEAPRYTTIEDSMSIDEDYTKDLLASEIPRLKIRLAERLKKDVRDQAKDRVSQLFESMIASIPNIDSTTRIKVIAKFQGEP